MIAIPSDTPATDLDTIAQTLERPLFFIASCSKSGSTWLQHLLDAHPQAVCHGESFFPVNLRPLLRGLARQYNQMHKCGHSRNQHQRSGDLTEADLTTLYRHAVALVMGRWAAGEPDPDAIVAIGEKTPDNAPHTAELLSDFPTGQVIHLIRDPRDVCVSGYFHNLREKGDAFKQRFPTLASYIPLMAAQKWKPYIEQARAGGVTAPDRFHELRYEALHTNAVETLADVLRFLGLDDDEATVKACLESASFGKLSGGRDRGDEDRGSFYRKGQVGDWQEHFDDACIEAFNACVGEFAASLGYA
ncbi:MAG: sulfotransferase [Planctomycetota bacterium]